MKLPKKQVILKWMARIVATAILVFALPFYFGDGIPLPFIQSDYTSWDNIWLSVIPLVFIGLAIGWKYEKTGGYLITISIIVGFILSIVIENDVPLIMLVPFAAGILYLFSGYGIFGKEGVPN